MKKEETMQNQSGNDSDLIWSEIKDHLISMFSLPPRPLHEYCKRMNVEPSKVYLTYTVGSVITALETQLGSKYKVDTADKYITVSRA